MKTYFYGSPDKQLIGWAFTLRRRFHWLKWPLFFVVALILVISMPISFICVQIGRLGHWLAYGLGIDSRDLWE
jgi:hypothetical protein